VISNKLAHNIRFILCCCVFHSGGT